MTKHKDHTLHSYKNPHLCPKPGTVTHTRVLVVQEGRAGCSSIVGFVVQCSFVLCCVSCFVRVVKVVLVVTLVEGV